MIPGRVLASGFTREKELLIWTWFIVLTVFDFNEQDYSLTLDSFQGNASWFLACKLITDGSMFNFRWYFMMQNHLPLNSRLLILGRSLGFFSFFSLSVSPIPSGFFFLDWVCFSYFLVALMLINSALVRHSRRRDKDRFIK